ncbi:Os11g0629100 [Oryza sativa Japonica Group]|uniref:Os11g0629100 protein n=2 Tax=Oryza TaxID=4527 RepID=A0A0P0Y4I6_ORYSJ|nr:Os11g0629100 [Oryza sativa Japonica Group]
MFSCESVIAPRLLDSVVQCFQERPDLAINIFIFLWVIAPLVELMLSYPITVKKNNIYPLTNIMLLSTQISTLILKVDLACHKCYNKIRKILCNLQDQERITTISYDTKNNIVVIAGTFDPQRLCCRIRCKGGKIIKDIHIVDAAGGGKPAKMPDSPPPSLPPPVNTGKKKWKKDKRKEIPPPPPLAETPPPMNERPPTPPPVQPPPDRETSAMVPAIVEEEKPRDRVAELEPPSPHKEMPLPQPTTMEMPPPPVTCTPVVEKPRPPPCARPFYPVDMATPTMVEIPSWPAAPAPPSCCAPPPCYQGCYEGCRCGGCGRVYGYSVPSARPPPLLPPPCYSGGGGGGYTPYCGGYSGCRLVNEEDPTACVIM